MVRLAVGLFAALLVLGAEDPVLDRVAAHADRFGAIAREIWKSPELAFRERKSSALLRDELAHNGFTIESGVAGMPTAFTATFGHGKPIIAILGEFDALPGLSQKAVPRREPAVEGAPGHGCGHNLLGSAAALAAVAIKEEMDARKLPGTIRFYGTPAEEGGGGKIYMVHAGLFRDVDVALTWHPGGANGVDLRSSLANASARFRFYGTAAHAAMNPDKGRSALDAVMVMTHAVELMREHVPQETRIHYIITNGGSASNIVPAFAEISLTARHPDANTLAGIWARIVKCAEAGALATETRFELGAVSGYANTLPNDALAALVGRNLRKTGGYTYTPDERQFADEIRKSFSAPVQEPGPETVVVEKTEGAYAASTDVGDVSWNLPTLSFGAATYVPGTPAHSWQSAACAGTTIGQKGMLVAARTLALSAVDLLEHPAEVDAARESFDKRRAGRTWKTPIATDAKPPLR